MRGGVHTCRTESEKWAMTMHETFSREGRLLERHCVNPDGSEWSIINAYDATGHLVEKVQGEQRYSYRYDALGRLDCVILHSAKHEECVFESVQYSADGARTKTVYPIQFDEEQRKSAGVASEAALHFSLDAAVIMMLLDGNDRLLRKVLYDMDERVIRRIGFRYDDRGLLVEEGELIGGMIQEEFRNLFRYDNLGRQIEVDRACGGCGHVRRTLAYNDHGDIVREMIEQWVFDEDREAWSQEFTYEYDSKGNWTRRKMETILPMGERRLDRVDRRELAYF